jgi:S-adenosylmethionine:tRNA ribosyltransferase-isomerase
MTCGSWPKPTAKLPLPPYIEHPAEGADETRYQTVYAREPGAVAAPTAGLHFDEAMLATLRAQGVKTAFLTLHVGAGTYQPVRVDKIAEHRMHSERLRDPAATAMPSPRPAPPAAGSSPSARPACARSNRPATPTARCESGPAETDIFITPGYRFKVVDRLITNFHLPKSTLLMLVSAFAGYDNIRAAYATPWPSATASSATATPCFSKKNDAV